MVSKHKKLERGLISAVLTRDPDLARDFLNQGAPVNARDPEHDETPLMLAAMVGDDSLMLVLLDSGAELEARDNRGRSALFFVAAGSPCFEALVAAGADVHVRDADGNTLLLRAIETSQSVMEVDRLLALGVDPSLTNVAGESALDAANLLGLTNLVDRLRRVTRSN